MKKYLTVCVFGVLTWLLLSCNRETVPDPDPEMNSTTDMICKSRNPLKGETPGSDQTCVSWTYADETLTMTHYNAGFNCCPEKILTSMRISGDTIYLTERDSLQLCRCNCLYDIKFVITHLKKGTYVVRFDEPFVIDPKEPLEFEVDLKNLTIGKYCQDRDYYPWGS